MHLQAVGSAAVDLAVKQKAVAGSEVVHEAAVALHLHTTAAFQLYVVAIAADSE